MSNHSFNIDWLQVYCIASNDHLFTNCQLFQSFDMVVVKKDYSSRQFKDIYEVYTNALTMEEPNQHNHDYNDNYLYCTIQATPSSSILDPRSVIIKLSNRECYNKDCVTRLISFMSHFDLKFKSISRLDLCYDCVRFKNDMSVPKFVEGFMSQKFLKNCQPKYKLNLTTDGDARDNLVDSLTNDLLNADFKNKEELRKIVELATKRKIKRIDNDGVVIDGSVRDTRQVNAITFGDRTSAVHTVLYNKSKEMRDVKVKHYIVDDWKANGLDVGKDVWRYEIRIKPSKCIYVRLDTGEMKKVELADLASKGMVAQLFMSFAERYADFRINDGTRNKSRMRKLELFDEEPSQFCVKPVTWKKDTSKAGKVFLHKLVESKYMLPFKTRSYDEATDMVATTFAINHNLGSYLNYIENYYRDLRKSVIYESRIKT